MKQAVFHGQEMWIGIADVASGTIRETHTLEEAKRADFHTCFYFSEESEKKHENKDGIFFWVQDGMSYRSVLAVWQVLAIMCNRSRNKI